MKTPLTREGRPTDVIARWTVLEERVTAEHEQKCLAVIRHVLLGCSLCKDEEVIEYLVGWPRKLCTFREALLILDILSTQYIFSEQGKREMLLLHQGRTPVFHHTDSGPRTDDAYPSKIWILEDDEGGKDERREVHRPARAGRRDARQGGDAQGTRKAR
jgi:hypothetical protein